MHTSSSYPLSIASYSDLSFPSKLPLSRQPSLDLSSFLSSGLSGPSLFRQASFSSSAFPALDEDPFSFAFGDFDGGFKAGVLDDYNALRGNRVSSYDSDMSSAWSSGSEGSAPLSPHSPNDSLSDASSQSSDDLFSSHPTQVDGRWAHEERARATAVVGGAAVKEDFTGPAVRGFPELQRSMSTASPIPVLPLPFTPTVYAFNYHSAEEEPSAPTAASSNVRHERREGLRGGGASRGSYDHHSGRQQRRPPPLGRRRSRVVLPLHQLHHHRVHRAFCPLLSLRSDLHHLPQVPPPLSLLLPPVALLLSPPLPLPLRLPPVLRLPVQPLSHPRPQRGGDWHLHARRARRQDRALPREARQPAVEEEDHVRLQEVVRGQPAEGGWAVHQDEAGGGGQQQQ